MAIDDDAKAQLAEAALLAQAPGLHTGQLRQLGEELVYRADPDMADERERRGWERRYLSFGLTLDEIREVLAFAERGEPPCGFVRERLRREVAAIDARIAELQALQGELAGLEARAGRLPPPAEGEYCPLVHVNQDPGRARPAAARRAALRMEPHL